MGITDLRYACDTLKTALLPDTKGGTDLNFSEEQLHKISAYCVMMHAEIEFFIESVLRTHTSDVLKQFDTVPSTFLLPNLCFHYGQDNSLKDTTNLVRYAKEWYYEIIADNHGVKTDNIKKMLNPIGLSIDDFDQSLISELHSFGDTRGRFAHNSFKKVMQEIPNPDDIYDKMKRIIDLLVDFETKVSTHK